jgi:hypothetical protein
MYGNCEKCGQRFGYDSNMVKYPLCEHMEAVESKIVNTEQQKEVIMYTKTEGRRKVSITEGDAWTVETFIVHNDIIRELDCIDFYREKDMRDYVNNFFICKNEK